MKGFSEAIKNPYPDKVTSPDLGVLFLTDCILHTIFHLSVRKSPPKGEINEQIKIAQAGVSMIMDFGIGDYKNIKSVKEVIDQFKGDVEAWARNAGKEFGYQGKTN